MARTTTVCVSKAEKAKLSMVQQLLFGAEDVPYGRVIDELCREYVESEMTDNKTEINS
jgi:hypothetical protein